MKAVVAHHLWPHIGGGELLVAYAAKTLSEAGYDVAIASTYNFDREKYREWFGIDLNNTRVYALLPRMLPLFVIYQTLGLVLPLRNAVEKEKPDIVFLDNDLYKPILGLKKDLGFAVVEYMQDLSFRLRELLYFSKQMDRFGKENPFKVIKERWELLGEPLPNTEKCYKKYERGLWRYYFRLWLELYGKVVRENPFEAADVVAATSAYIGRLIKILWDDDAVVLHPPVMIKDFSPYGQKPFEERDNAVLMISRIRPEKRIEDAIDAVALTETKPVLRVIGGLTPTVREYKAFLEKRAREKGVKVEFYSNIPRSQLVRVVTSSRVFVHAALGEPFGVGVVEGMAAGCPVVVHRSGGPYEDILDYGRYGLTYQSVDELAENIDKLMQPDVWHHYHKLSLKRAPRFSEEEFTRRFLEIIEKLG